MRKVLVVLIAIIIIAVIALYIRSKPQEVGKPGEMPKATVHFNEQKDMDLARRLIEENKTQQALEIIKQYENPAMIHTENGRQWLSILIDAYTANHDAGRLTFIYDHLPDLFSKHEKACTYILHTFINQEKLKEIETLRGTWAGKETLPVDWFYVDCDILAMQGKREQAKKMLLSKEFEGKDDVGRLVRLAFLVMMDSPNQALSYLVQAQKKDSQNPEIYILRAKILETFGETELANFEYTVAQQLAPTDLAIRDQLAEFYRRQGKMELALKIWKDSLTPPSSDLIWLKVLFWNKVYGPLNITWDAIQKPEGPRLPLIDYLINLPQNVFWDEKTFAKLEEGKKYLHSQQITFWLRLCQYLKDGKEKEALDLLQTNPFKFQSWDPLLEKTLAKILIFRDTGIMPSDLLVDKNPTNEKQEARLNALLEKRHPFFLEFNSICKELVLHPEQLNLPPSLTALFKSPDVFSAIFLADAWPEASLLLAKNKILSKDYPEWFAAGMIQATRFIDGPKAALDYAHHQVQNNLVRFAIAELELEIGQTEEAIGQLQKLTTLPSDIGFKSTYLLANCYFNLKNFDAAKSIIEKSAELKKSTIGQELLARIAVAENNEELAMRIYSNIEKDSAEAKSFLAQKAFAEKNFARAKKLTEELLREHPTNTAIQMNYLRMVEEEKKQTATVD
jgi:tetratricopeptide (TPR) repeat protein